MHVFIIYAHPSKNSFTHTVLHKFTEGLSVSNHTYEVSNLYEIKFKTDMGMDEYERELGIKPNKPISTDIKIEQEKILRANILAFIYPVWWSDCPAKMKGWFDRVYTFGFAYTHGDRTQIRYNFKDKKALVICSAGHTVEHLEEIGIAESMRKVMINDRLLGLGIEEARMYILGGTASGERTVLDDNLNTAFCLGRDIK